MSLASRSTRSVIILGASNIVTVAIGFLGGIVLARLLAPNDFGTFALATTIATLADLRSKLQLDQKYLTDQAHPPEHYNTFYTLNVGLALISFVALLIAGVIIWRLGRADLALSLAAIAALGLLDPLASTIRLSLEKQVTFGVVALIQSGATILQFVVTLIAALLGWGLWSLLIGLSVNALANLLLFMRMAERRPRLQLNRQLAREFLAFGFKYGVVFATALALMTQFDDFVVGLFRGTAELGYYDRAYRTSLWPTLLFSGTLGRVSLPTYAAVKDNPAQLAKAFSFVLWTVLSFTMPLAMLFVFTAPELVTTLYGANWLPVVPLLQALAAFSVFRAMLDDARSILVATDRPAVLARLTVVQAVVMVLLVIPLTYWQGSLGTAIAVGLAFLISTVYVLYFGLHILHVNLFESAGLPLVNNVLTAAAFLTLRAYLPLARLPAWQQLSVEVPLLLGLYGLISLATGPRLVVSRVTYIVKSLRG